MKYLILFFLLLSCNQLEYKSDKNLTINTGKAGYPNFPTIINGRVCRNIQGIVGNCMISVSKSTSLFVTMKRRPYNYNLDIKCSSKIGFSPNCTVGKDKDFTFEIPYDIFSPFDTFLCDFLVFPQDKRKGYSFSRVFVNVHESVRQPQSNVGYVYDCKKEEDENCKGRWKYLGQQSFHAYYRGNHHKKPYVKCKGKGEVIAETYSGRFNYVEE